MVLDGLRSDNIEVDGVMSRPSDPMPCERKCARVFAPIAFSVRKSFWKKFLGKGVACVAYVASVVFIKKFPLHLATLATLCDEQIRSRDPLLCKKQKPTEKPIGGLPLYAVDQLADIILTPDGRVLTELDGLGVFAFADSIPPG